MPAPLPVGKVLMGAFLIPWWNRKAFVRALAIPVMLIVAFTLSWSYASEHLPMWVNWVACFGYSAFFALFAVTCHRLVLLDPAEVAKRAEPRWSRRESLFFGWLIGVWLIYMLVALAVGMSAGTVVLNIVREDGALRWVEYLGKVAAYYFVARVSLVFPATAIDRRLDFRGAWQLTRNNGWRLFVIIGVLPWVLSYLFEFAYRSNPTPPEILLLSIAGTALFTFEIAALSISYRELTKERQA